MINQGITFGWLSGIPVWVIGIVWILLFYYAVNVRELWSRRGLSLILLGGAANLVSRLKHGGVIDNLTLAGLFYNNIADYLIFFGLVIYGYTYFVRR